MMFLWGVRRLEVAISSIVDRCIVTVLFEGKAGLGVSSECLLEHSLASRLDRYYLLALVFGK